MSSIPNTETLTVLDDQGSSPLYFSVAYSSKDSYENLKAHALSKATQVTERGPQEIGTTFSYLSAEARWYFYKAKLTTVARFLEILYLKNYKHGLLTAKEAARLTGWGDYTCRIALSDLEEYIGGLVKLIKKRNLGELFTGFFTLQENRNMKKSVNKSPHKKGAGSGKKKGPKQKEYFVPGWMALNSLNKTVTYYAFDLQALHNNKYYNACIAKMMIVGKSLHRRLWSEANRLQVSQPTLRRWHELTNVGREAWITEVELTPEEVAALPKNAQELTKAMKERTQRFGTVHNEAGYSRLAHKDSLLGNTPSKAHFMATGEFLEQGPLEGALYYDKRIGTILTDLGGWVYEVKKSE